MLLFTTLCICGGAVSSTTVKREHCSSQYIAFVPSEDCSPSNMKRIIVWSILVTAVFATDGSIYIAEAETKGPGRK
jgi:hypothetical protein